MSETIDQLIEEYNACGFIFSFIPFFVLDADRGRWVELWSADDAFLSIGLIRALTVASDDNILQDYTRKANNALDRKDRWAITETRDTLNMLGAARNLVKNDSIEGITRAAVGQLRTCVPKLAMRYDCELACHFFEDYLIGEMIDPLTEEHSNHLHTCPGCWEMIRPKIEELDYLSYACGSGFHRWLMDPCFVRN